MFLLIFQSRLLLFKKITNNTSICHCFVFYFTQICLSDRVLFPCPTTHVFALCRIYPCFVLFHMLFILTYISKCKYLQLYGGVMTPYVLFLYVSFDIDQIFFLEGVYNVIYRYLEAQTNTWYCANCTRYMYVSFISSLYLSNLISLDLKHNNNQQSSDNLICCNNSLIKMATEND